ncbi:MAG TPA: ribosome maturation factor RimP [Clostridia bacterium]|nr:ribosome maturation factor RimP [Clostridia bacterium]
MLEIIAKAKQIITPVVVSLGFEVVDIEYKKQYNENNLTVYIYKKGGVSLDDCELVNNALDTVLEENDPTEGQTYNLNISSPGLDRKVVSCADFRRSLDTDLELVFVNPMGKRKQTHGMLISYDDESVTIRQKDKDTKYERSNLSIIRPYINFK